MIFWRGKRAMVIAGPCGAETREQTLETCVALAKTGVVDMLRAGIWKPRTAPGSFEGAGLEGLKWMAEAKRVTGLPVGVEVATARHVENALKYGVDCVWIGARTTVSPFAVQELAEALKGGGVAVLVKNPVNPDIELWAGAVGRLLAAGIPENDVGLIHRGFSSFGQQKYRNTPGWTLAFEMRNRFPGMMMIADPSHMGGAAEYVAELSQTAADLRYDGLIIESHIRPAEALSDARQQLTPDALGRLVRTINWRAEAADDPEFVRAINTFRDQIDQIDAEIFSLLSRRMEISEQIGRVKKNNDVAILQPERWAAITRRVFSQADALGLSSDFAHSILETIHLESIKRQDSVMNITTE
jgi:chorismate mutase